MITAYLISNKIKRPLIMLKKKNQIYLHVSPLYRYTTSVISVTLLYTVQLSSCGKNKNCFISTSNQVPLPVWILLLWGNKTKFYRNVQEIFGVKSMKKAKPCV